MFNLNVRHTLFSLPSFLLTDNINPVKDKNCFLHTFEQAKKFLSFARCTGSLLLA